MKDNPHQVTFWLFGFACFVGSVIAGLVTRYQGDAHYAAYGELSIALAILSVGFFALFTAIHLKH